MVPQDKMKQKIQEQVESKSPAVMPASAPITLPAYSHMRVKEVRDKVYDAFNNGDYKELESILSSGYFEENDKNLFFKKAGDSILNAALEDIESAKPLAFLFKHVPSHIFKKLLTSNDFNPIKSFLKAALTYVSFGFDSPEKQACRKEKLEILRSIAKEEVDLVVKQLSEDPSLAAELEAVFGNLTGKGPVLKQ